MTIASTISIIATSAELLEQDGRVGLDVEHADDGALHGGGGEVAALAVHSHARQRRRVRIDRSNWHVSEKTEEGR